MGIAEKQATERQYFERFCGHYPLPSGDIVYGDRPDVIINGSSTLGIEIACVYKTDGRNPESEQQQSKDREHVVRQAENEYLSTGGRPVQLNIGFDVRYPIERKRINIISSNLAKLAAEISQLEKACVRNYPLEEYPEVSFVHQSGETYADNSWTIVQSYDVPCLSVERVSEIVRQKVEKIKGYQPCDSYWLLLIVNFWDPAQDQDIRWPKGSSVPITPFDRILIYKTDFPEVVEVVQQ